MKKTALLLCAFVMFALSQTFAQTLQVSGRVTSSGTTNDPLSGATVTVKGTTTATTTDAQGNYSITVPQSGSTLVVSYAGAESQERVVTSAGTNNFSVVLTNNTLTEVVVNVGYGSQKKSVVTGSISSVKAKDFENQPNGRIEQALQGRVSGVTIAQNAGQPGSGSTIRVRGITTFGNNEPLWVVDGVVVDPGGIAYINQSDIESIEVLKDATSSAIYGTRAAGGVILVTTKKGRSGKMVVAYNGFYGVSRASRKLDLLNATEYATLINERLVAGGGNIKYADPASFGEGTDWQREIFNNSARRSNHELSLSGGTDKSTFYLSFGMQDQQGIVATDISKYRKQTIRLNSTHKISKVFTFGQTIGYARQKSSGLGNTNSEFGGPLSSAINLDPLTPVVVTDPAVINQAPYTNVGVVRDPLNYPYGISANVGQEMTNPKAYIQTRLGGYAWSDDFIGNAYLEANFLQHFKLRSTVGGKKAFYGSQGFTPVFYLSPTVSNTKNNFGKSTNDVFNWNLENTLQYSNKIGNHAFDVLIGQGAYEDGLVRTTSAAIFNLPISSYEDASFNFDIPQVDRTSGAYQAPAHHISSLFTRANYNYMEKYLFTGIIRRDGSTNFGSNKKFGYFPSASLGWVVSKEDFWPANRYVKSLKIRGGYGEVGNDAIGGFGYATLVGGGFNYAFGGSAITTGYAPLSLANPDLEWESTNTANIGMDAQLFDHFTMSLEVFNKKTTGILQPIPTPGYVGVTSAPVGNVASMKNEGLELELGYRNNFGDLSFGASGNMSLIKNTVTYINLNTEFIGGGASFQSMGNITRIQVGQSFNAFYGFKTAGIFQTLAEVTDYKDKNGATIQPDALPGDFRFQDTNGDGSITDDDKVFLGTNLPKVTYGFTFNFAYKGFDMNIFGQGAGGNKIFQGLRRLDIAEANYSTKALSRWTGPGTSNEFPRLTSNDVNGNFTKMSDFYLEKGDYLRLKVVQLGYTFNNRLLGKIGASSLRLYVTGENLVTFTDYTGYDPEIGGGVFGVDRGYYPQPRSFIFGAQLQF